ncbi:MAG: 1-phosphofructokinase [Clostridiales bacterium]|nr:1-phosphofructokinase [Clostridiales bacterium]
MILTVTMNVAIDKTYVLTGEHTPGSVLRVSACSATPGGKGLNVAKAVQALGEPVLATGIIGGHAGSWIRENLELKGVPCDFEPAPGESRTCINIVEPSGRQTEFLEPGLVVSSEIAESFMRRFKGLVASARAVTISGSLPQGLPEDFYAGLIGVCKKAGKPVILDTSGRLLQAGVAAKPDMIKPNLEELGQLLGRDAGQTPDAVVAAARRLHDSGIALVVVSMGSRGAVAAGREGVYHAAPPSIQAVSATGSGDSMTAGFAVGLVRGWPLEKTLCFATAAAAANALELETGRVDMKNVHELLQQVHVKLI